MKKNIFIMGDSYSTYEGYIPEGYHFYYSDGRKDNPIVKGVEKTWWNILANENNFNIIINDSKSAKQMLTILIDDLYTYQGTVQGNMFEEVVLLFQVSDSVAEEIQKDSLKLKVTDSNSNSTIITLD